MTAAVPRVEFTTSQCKGCRLCMSMCPKQVIAIAETFNVLGYQPAYYKGEGCNGCGICFYACPEPGAIRVVKKEG